jgi:Flp pilus assembly protein TadB
MNIIRFPLAKLLEVVSTRRCCEVAAIGSQRGAIGARKTEHPRRSFARRLSEIAGWAVSGTILVLLPKCPACLAAYVAIGTGVGVSLSTASYLRLSLVALCAASLSILAARQLRRFIKRFGLHQ